MKMNCFSTKLITHNIYNELVDMDEKRGKGNTFGGILINYGEFYKIFTKIRLLPVAKIRIYIKVSFI